MIRATKDISSDVLAKKNAASFRKKLKEAALVKSKFDIDFCYLIWSAKNTFVSNDNKTIPFYEYCNYNSWNAFVEKELSLTSKTANNYAKVYQAFAVDLGKTEIAKKHILPISKMIALAPIINKNNVDDLINVSKEISYEDFKKLTLGSQYKQLTETNEFITFLLNKGARKIIDKALDKASKEFGLELTQGELIVKIVKSYLKS